VNDNSELWYLYKDDVLLGTFENCESDWPWLSCTFVSTAAFDQYRALFEREATHLEKVGADEILEMYADQITQAGLRLVPADPIREVEDYILHISGSEGWFRIIWVGH